MSLLTRWLARRAEKALVSQHPRALPSRDLERCYDRLQRAYRLESDPREQERIVAVIEPEHQSVGIG